MSSNKMRGGVREPHMSREDLKKSLGKGSTVWRLFSFIFKNYKILVSGTDDYIGCDSLLLEPLNLRINRCGSYTACDKDDLKLLKFLNIHFTKFGRSSERSDDIMKRIAFLKFSHHSCRCTDCLKYKNDGSLLPVIITDGKRNSLSVSRASDYYKLTGQTSVRSSLSLNLHLDNVVGNAVSGNLVTVFLRARHPRVSSTWMCVF